MFTEINLFVQKNHFVNIRNLLEQGNYAKLKSYLNELKVMYDNNIKDLLELTNFESYVNILTGNYQDALKIINWVNEQNKSLQNLHIQVNSGLFKCEALHFLSNYEECSHEIEKIEQLIENLKIDKIEIIRFRAILEQLKGRYSIAKGKLDEALDHLFQSQALYIKCEAKFDLGSSQNLIARTYWQKGELAKASEFLNLAITVFTKLKNKKMVGATLNNLGLLKLQIGDYDISIQNFKLARKIAQESSDIQTEADCLNNLGNVNLYIGKLKEAYDYYLESLSINEKIGGKNNIASITSNLGDISRALGNFKEAIELYQKSSSIFKEIKAGSSQFENSVNLILTLVDIRNYASIKTYLSDLKKSQHIYSSYKLKMGYKIAKAYYLMHSKNIKDVLNAKNIFREIFEASNVNFENKSFSMICYCLIIFKMWIFSKDNENLHDVKKIALKLIKNARNSLSFYLLLHSYIILSYTLMIEGNLVEAYQFFLKAEEISKEKSIILPSDIKNLSSKISDLKKLPELRDLAVKNLKQELYQIILTRNY